MLSCHVVDSEDNERVISYVIFVLSMNQRIVFRKNGFVIAPIKCAAHLKKYLRAKFTQIYCFHG